MSEERTITLRKFIVATKLTNKNGTPMQILGNGLFNRSKNGREFDCSDMLFAENILPDLQHDEGERGVLEVDCTISLDPFPGAVSMWCFGKPHRNRSITPYKPILVGTDNNPEHGEPGNVYEVKGGSMSLDECHEKTYFDQIPAGEIFPVWVSVSRIPEKV